MEQPKGFLLRTDYGILYEDDSLLVVDKPAPLPVHAAGSYGERNLLALLRQDPRWRGRRLWTPHRLDSETSGVLVLGKTLEAGRSLGRQFGEGRVRKRYLALVHGSPGEREGVVRQPLGSVRMGFVVRVPDEAGESAETRWRVVSTVGRFSLLEVEPVTGRTHQIRAHLAWMGCPVVGDKIYPDPSRYRRYVVSGLGDGLLAELLLPRLALHASRLGLVHPASGERVEYASPLPEPLVAFCVREGLEVMTEE